MTKVGLTFVDSFTTRNPFVWFTLRVGKKKKKKQPEIRFVKLGDGEEGDDASDSADDLQETDDYCEDIVS